MTPAPVRTLVGPLSAVDWPGDGRPLVLLHGVFDSAECWTGVAQQLPCRVTAFDLDAHGHTPLFDGDFTMRAMTEHVIQALEAYGAGPVSLGGHSMGGLVAHEVALTRPDLVAALWLEDPAWVAATEPLGAATHFVTDRAAQLRSWTPDQVLAQGRADHPRWSDDEFGTWLQAKQDVDLDFVDRRQDWTAAASASSCADLDMNTWLLTANPAMGAVVDEASAITAMEGLGERGTRRHFPNCGHDIRKDDRAAYVSVLDEFLLATA